VFPNSVCQYLHNRDSDNDFVPNIVNIRTEHKPKREVRSQWRNRSKLTTGCYKFYAIQTAVFLYNFIFSTNQPRQLDDSTGLSRYCMEYSLPREPSICSQSQEYPNFVNFEVFFSGDVAGNYLLLKHSAASIENRTPTFSVKLLCFETSGTKYSVTKHDIPENIIFDPKILYTITLRNFVVPTRSVW